MNYSMDSGIIRYIRASKTFSKFRAFRSFVCFEVPCASKFRVLRSSVRSPLSPPFTRGKNLFGVYSYINYLKIKLNVKTND